MLKNILGSCLGPFLGDVAASSASECNTICRDSEYCNWWTFHKNDKFCTFVTDCISQDDSCNDCTYGYRSCQEQKGRHICHLAIVWIISDNNKQSLFPFQQILTPDIKIMVVSSTNSFSKDAEILSISADNTIQCEKPADLSTTNAAFGTGAFFNGLPTVCENSRCSTYSFETSNWNTSQTLLANRDGLRSVLIDDDKLWLTGGRGLSSTEIISNGTTESGPRLPHEMFFHCVVKVNETHFLFAGGRSQSLDETLSDVYFFNWIEQEWTQTTRMRSPRDLHTCALLQNPTRVMAIGGIIPEVIDYKTTEIFDVETESWSEGPDLPSGMSNYGAQVIPYLDSFLLVGGCGREDGKNFDTFQLDLQEMAWIERPEKLEHYRCNHVAFEIPNDSCV